MKYSPELQDKFEKYAELLRDWQQRANLVAPSTLGDIQHRHIDDSTQLAEYLPKGATVIDLGSGAGFPATVLAIMGWDVIAIESIRKKTNFLEELKTQLNLPNLTVKNDRVENFLTKATLPRDVIFTARAFAPLIKILDYIWLYKKTTGKKSEGATIDAAPAVLLKGVNVSQEIAAARRKYKFNYELFPSKTGDGFIVAIKNINKKPGQRITGPRSPVNKEHR